MLVLGFCTLLVIRLVYNFFQLSSTGVKGPFLASLTDVWRAYEMRQPLFEERINSLHKKYGNLVRLGPRYVSVIDPTAVPVVFGTRPVWKKVSQICLHVKSALNQSD